MKKYKILKNWVNYLDYEILINKVIIASKKNKNLSIAPVASHSIVESIFNKKLRTSLNSFDFVLPDGQSLVWAANFLYGYHIKERIYGPDLLLKLCSHCEKEKIRVIFYGNHTDLVTQKIKKRFPKIIITTLPDLKYKKVKNTDVKYLLDILNKYKKSIAFIGIGSPAQHILLAKLKQAKMPKTKKQAHGFFKKTGLEWFFRLMSEPKRLWKRYLIYLPIFIGLIICKRIINLIDNLFNL